jgi:hypothetical protein
MKGDKLEATRRIMGALVRQPPKPHGKMKIGKRKAAKKNSTAPKPKRAP